MAVNLTTRWLVDGARHLQFALLRQTRIVAQRRHFLTARRQTFTFQRAKLGEQAARGGEIHDRRRIKPGELFRIRAAQQQEIHHQPGEIAL